MTASSFYRYHVFFCINQRQDGRSSCEDCGATTLQRYAKERIKALNINGPQNIRINQAGCLGRCSLGPVMVVYPEGIWYTYVDEQDIDEIITSHLINHQSVTRLRLPDNTDEC